MPRPKDVHVIPAGDDGWAIEIEGQSDQGYRSYHPTQDKAIRVGRKLAADNRSELLIHWHDTRARDARYPNEVEPAVQPA